MSRKEQWFGVRRAGVPAAGRFSNPCTVGFDQKKSSMTALLQAPTTASTVRRRLRLNSMSRAYASMSNGQKTTTVPRQRARKARL